MTMGEHNKRVCINNGPGLAPPEMPVENNFELKGHILMMLKDIPFSKKDHKDVFRHIYEFNDIANYFNVPNVVKEAVLLGMLLVTFTGATKIWLKSLALGTITTWTNLYDDFIEKFSLPSNITKLKNKIANFQQNDGESLFEAWERYKGMLWNCPQHNINVQQEVSIFYDGVNVTTGELLDSQGPMTNKEPNTIKELIEEFAKHSRKYHNP